MNGPTEEDLVLIETSSVDVAQKDEGPLHLGERDLHVDYYEGRMDFRRTFRGVRIA